MTICLFIDIGVPGTSKKLPVLSLKGQVFCCAPMPGALQNRSQTIFLV